MIGDKMPSRKKRRRLNDRLMRRHRSVVNRAVKIKVKHNFSFEQLKDVLKMYHREEAATIMQLVKQEFADEGYFAHRIHGCAGCDNFMWLHHEHMDCPHCNNSDGRYLTSLKSRYLLTSIPPTNTLRYDDAGAPKQEVFYFPLLPRLTKMYQNEEWRRSIMYPEERPRRLYSRSDVFDGTVYKQLRRDAGRCDHFLSLSYCADGIPADKRMARKVLPGIMRYVYYTSICIYS